MDIAIPGIDGYEATRILKGSRTTSHIPILAVTARAMTTDRALAAQAGCDAWLSKPCMPHTVVAEVLRLLARSATHPN